MFLKNIKMQPKLIGLFLLIGLIPLILVGGWSYSIAKKSLMDSAYSQLIGVREIKKFQLENLFSERQQDMGILLGTIEEFRKMAFEKLETVQEIKIAQLKNFFNEIRIDMEAIARSQNVIDLYSALKKYHDDIKTTASDAFDVTSIEYQRIYDRHDDYFQKYLESYGYHDLFLICADHGHVMFSVAKESDLGTNLVYGPYKDEGLARLWKKIRESKEVVIEDFAIYSPTNRRHTAFVGAPIYDESKAWVGIVALQIPIEPIDTIVQRHQGMGKSGETYLVGENEEGKVAFRSNMLTMGNGKYTLGYDITQIKTVYIEKALSGESGREVFTDSTGKMVMVAYDPMNLKGLKWACISKIDMEEAITRKQTDQDDYFARYIKKYGHHDLLLIHPDGNVFYSVKKEADYGTNILTGKYADSGLGKLVRKVLTSGSIGISDYEPYAPSNNEPASFIALPLMHDGKPELIAAIQLSLGEINQIMQLRDGMGETGETYLVGMDKRMRSDSYLDPEGHSVKASFAGTIQKNGVDTVAAQEALEGKTAIQIIHDYNGNPVLSAYTSINILDFTWALLAEIDLNEVMNPVKQLIYSILIAVLIIAFAVLMMAIFIGRSISVPILKGVEFAKTVATGDLTSKIDVNQNDEIGILANALKEMSANLRGIIGNLKNMAQTLSSSSEELSAVSTQLASNAEETNAQSHSVSVASEEVSSSVNTVASAIEEASASVASIAAMTEEMSSTFFQVSEMARKTTESVNRIAQSSRDLSTGSNSIAAAVEEMTVSLNEVAKNTAKANTISQDASRRTEEIKTRMGVLLKSSKQIGKIVEMIKDIADQTNMLALNATIEAAGAGDAGKGFSVVAGEVKELAKQSREATVGIAGQIEQIQTSTREAFQSIEEINNIINEIAMINEVVASAIEEQSATTSEISKSVSINAVMTKQVADDAQSSSANTGDIARSIDEANNAAKEVAKHVEELAKGIQDVSRSTSQAALGVQDITQNIQGVSIASKETASGAENTRVSSDEISKIVVTLTDIIGRFKI